MPGVGRGWWDGALEKEIGVWSSQGGEKDKHFLFFKPRAETKHSI